MNNNTSTTTSRFQPGDRLQLTWLDPAGSVVDSDDLTITAHPGDPPHELWIQCPLMQHIGHAQPGDVISFDHAGNTVTVRIDAHNSENRP